MSTRRHRTVDELLVEARGRLRRLTPQQAFDAQRRGALLVDTRTEAQRRRDGGIPGSLVVDRTVLEWRLDPASRWRLPQASSHDVVVVVVCDEGYSSSLAAASLQALGLHRATDVIGGFQAWFAAGLPITRETDTGKQLGEHEDVFVPDSGDRLWDRVYTDKHDTDTSWYEPVPQQSLAMLDQLGVGPDLSVLDVGAGTSRLVDALLTRGHADVTALDRSAVALQRSKQRLGPRATQATWVTADIATWQSTRRFDVWHDRAVFHFLTDPAQRAGYVRGLRTAVQVGAAVVLATFADDGPTHCSGLPVARYNPSTLIAALGVHLDVIAAHRVEHRTPWGAVQPFTWIAARRI